MAGHGLRHFQLAAVLQIRGDAGRPGCVAGGLGFYAGVLGPSLESSFGRWPGQKSPVGQLAVPHGEEGRGRLGCQAGVKGPFIQEGPQVMVAGQLVDLAAFFVQYETKEQANEARDRIKELSFVQTAEVLPHEDD